jgi:cell division protein FtsN
MGKFLIGLILGIVVAGGAVFYLNNSSAQFVNKMNGVSDAKINASSAPTILSPSTKLKDAETNSDNSNTSKESSQDYDFYRILQNKNTNTDNNSKDNNSKSISSSYYVQAGSFSDISAANNMKAQLSLQGYDVSVKTMRSGNGAMNKVVLGPYGSEADAKYVQQDLKSNDVKTIILKIN